MKKTVILSQLQIEKVEEVAMQLKSRNAIKGDFSKALRQIINSY